MIVRAYEGKEPRFGKRVFVAENAAIIGDVDIDDDASIWYGVVLRGDIFHIRIGARSNVQDNCVFHVEAGSEPAILAEEVTVGHAAVVHGCTIDRGAHVGERALIGAGAVVREGMKVPPQTLVVGVPGQIKRALTTDELSRLERSWRNYVEYKDRYLR